MLHEILLSLAGHPSPLFDSSGRSGTLAEEFPLITPSEAALLAPLGELSRLHRALRSHASRISKTHTSSICRAVASSLVSVHLAHFRDKILEVEASILKKDASHVAAYDIAPLAGIVSEFAEWNRKMNWYWDLACFMRPASPSSARQGDENQCNGAGIINKLRVEAKTGYPDIEQSALELTKVADMAWLRQLTPWLLYGRLPSEESADFLVVEQHSAETGLKEFSVFPESTPGFVTDATASSIVFIGKILHQIRMRQSTKQRQNGISALDNHDMQSEHLRILSNLVYPLSATKLSSAVSAIRTSLSRRALQQLLPLPKVLRLLKVLEEFFLLGKGEFATTLIREADARLESRERYEGQSATSTITAKVGAGKNGVVFKETEMTTILNSTFAHMTSLAPYEEKDDETIDSILDLAKSLVRLTKTAIPKDSSTDFTDVLLPTPSALTMFLSPPLDLFLSSADITLYSRIHSYLLSIRRAHAHLTALWRLTSLRRVHPSPAGPPMSASAHGRKILYQRRVRQNKRQASLRKVWATCSKAVFFLVEITAYFEGAVVRSASQELSATLRGTHEPLSPSSRPDNLQQSDTFAVSTLPTRPKPSPPRAGSLAQDPIVRDPQHASEIIDHAESRIDSTTHDPLSIASTHAAFLASVSQALLLKVPSFTSKLKLLLNHVEVLVGQVSRLQVIHSNIDLEEDEGVVDALNDWRKDEAACMLEVDRARKKMDEALRACVDALSAFNTDDSSRLLPLSSRKAAASAFPSIHSKWEWRPPPLDRLLMKLEFSKLEAVDHDHEDNEFA